MVRVLAVYQSRAPSAGSAPQQAWQNTRPAREWLTGAHRGRATAVTGTRGVRFEASSPICWVLGTGGQRVGL
ncbi:hypothetical protein NDU88_007253 [Pleurodeles waltl]|uniref:Uncharacterized protein n=1 Tax=Pleurodeles waltl TaxID=8319 RepID=A0AAV7SS04_PLEWA|nr:hypothetical protein NDU88_007253 [Pleurodeles waltl]